MSQQGFFVTGTDTEVGKTRISVALIELLQNQGLAVAGMKPIASGCKQTDHGLRNDDALQLIDQSKVDLPYDRVNPYAFEPAIAPHIAADKVGTTIDLSVISNNFKQIKKQAGAVVVEGAGGWLVPINYKQTMADIAVEINLPIIVVVAIKLGCINHALLTIKAIEMSGLTIQGWIANQVQSNSHSDEIIYTLQQMIKAPCLGVIPHLKVNESASPYLNLA
ncbi:MAG: dethiobiotin synthase [Gammaproteobacteria bacterium]|nr:dethiobiotin synthase [Gammaproteobacteria bacterium]